MKLKFEMCYIFCIVLYCIFSMSLWLSWYNVMNFK